jgi:hypothetical protein
MDMEISVVSVVTDGPVTYFFITSGSRPFPKSNLFLKTEQVKFLNQL